MNLFNADFPFRSRDSALSIVPILVGTNPANTVIQWLTGLESKMKPEVWAQRVHEVFRLAQDAREISLWLLQSGRLV